MSNFTKERYNFDKSDVNSFDWNKFLNQNFKISNKTSKILRDAQKFAMSWFTCPCGSKIAIDRDKDYAPTDILLKDLGIEFIGYITNMRTFFDSERFVLFEKALEEAKSILYKIKNY